MIWLSNQIFTIYSEELKRNLTFRSYMRTHKEDVEKYSEVKLEAAKLYSTDIDSYCEYKGPCILKSIRKLNIVLIVISKVGEPSADGKSIKDLEVQPVKDDEIILDWLFCFLKRR